MIATILWIVAMPIMTCVSALLAIPCMAALPILVEMLQIIHLVALNLVGWDVGWYCTVKVRLRYG